MELYSTVDALLAPVSSGALMPVSGRYLLSLAEGEGCLERRQDMLQDAFYVPPKNCVRPYLSFFALSYRWLHQDHPDPAKFHLKIVAKFLELHFGRWGEADVSVFWDFGSLHQKPRTTSQEDLFKEGLKCSNQWYGSTKSTVLLQPCLPPGFDGVAYAQSGWCFVEAAISSVVKDYDQRWDLSKGMEIDADGSAVLRSKHYDTVKGMCQSDRMPPMSPSKVEQLLTTEKVFTSKADANIVANIYKTFFDIVSSSLRTLKFINVGWSASHLGDFVDVWPSFKSLQILDLSDNNFGDEGAVILARGLKANTSVVSLDISGNLIGDEGASALARAVKANMSLETLWMSKNKIGYEGVSALADALKANTSLALLLIMNNNIDDQGASALADALKANTSLALLNISENNIGDEGAGALADAFKANGKVRVNMDGNPGRKAFRRTLEGQAGY